MSAIALRKAGVADIDAVMTVMDESFDAAFGEAWTAAQCLGILGLPGVSLAIADRDAEPVGFALTRVVLDEAELLLLGVRPRFRRQGIGVALLGRAIGDARAAGAARLHLEVRRGNAAMALYHGFGLAQVGVRSGYYRGNDGTTHDALSLSVALDPPQAPARPAD